MGHWTVTLGRQNGRLLHWLKCSCVSRKTLTLEAFVVASHLYTKSDCPVARYNCSRLATAHDCDTGLYIRRSVSLGRNWGEFQTEAESITCIFRYLDLNNFVAAQKLILESTFLVFLLLLSLLFLFFHFPVIIFLKVFVKTKQKLFIWVLNMSSSRSWNVCN